MVKFNLSYDFNVTLEQRIGFQLAASIYELLFTDDTVINFHISASDSLDNDQAVGGAVPIFHEVNYGVLQQYLALDKTSNQDTSVLEALQTGNTVDFLLNGQLITDNTTVMLTRAQAKALGMEEALELETGGIWTRDMVEDPTALDGYVVINNSYDWNYDFKREDAAPEDTLDFLTMALHELGHGAGFVSGLDGLIETFEMHSGELRTEGATLLDLLRYSQTSTTIENPDGSVSDLSFGGAAYFSLDGGATALAEFEEGNEFQASHWQRFQEALGIMDPTLGYQERTDLSYLDMQAFDVLGWNVDYHAYNAGIDLDALYAQAVASISEDFSIGVAAVEGAIASGQDWYTLGHGSWWQAFKDQMLDLGHGSWWAEFEEDLMALGHGSWWQAFDEQILQLGHGSWWQIFEDQVWALGHGSWWQEFKDESLLELGHGSWWQEFEPQMLEQSFGNLWQIFEEQMLALGHGSWWAELETQLMELGHGSWWQAFEDQILDLGHGSWWQIFEDTVLELGHGSWWQEFENSMAELRHGSWWQVFELRHGSWWQEVEQHLEHLNTLDQAQAATANTSGVVTGGDADDILAGHYGQDLISGAAGDDLIDGKEGHDILFGDEGDDIVYGWTGEDHLFGGEGDDFLAGENDNDQIYGEEGHDIASGGRGDDVLDGGEGRDVLKGDTGSDVIYGGTGDDQLLGGTGEDLLIGGEGADLVNGGDEDDVLYGDTYFIPVTASSSETNNQQPDTNPVTSADDAIATLDFWTRIEAEDMWLFNYSQQNEADASGGSVIATNWIGSATTTFNGPDGNYDFLVGYDDEASGTSKITLVVWSGWNQKATETWYLDSNGGAGTYQISDISLEAGDKITIWGDADGDDSARLDYLDIFTAGSTPNLDNTGTSSGNFYQFVGSTNNIIHLEIEDMDLWTGAQIAQEDYVSGGSYVRAGTSSLPATATSLFSGEKGYYDIVVGYYDENDGAAEIIVEIDNQEIDRWFAAQDLNTSSVNPNGLVNRTIGVGVEIDNLDLLKITAIKDSGDEANLDYIQFIKVDQPGPPPEEPVAPLVDPIRVEAEDMSLSGSYNFEDQSFASGDRLIKTGSSLTATTDFTGPEGYYDIIVGYYDENDGNSPVTVQLDGTTLDSWTFNQNLGNNLAGTNNFVTRTISSAEWLNPGATLQIQASKNSSEYARIDYVEFVAVANPNPQPESTEPVSPIVRIEAEDMALNGYSVESRGGASGDVIRVGSNGTASVEFSGATGTYDVVIRYVDEIDGSASLNFKVAGNVFDSWALDDNTGSSDVYADRIISGVELTTAALIEIEGTQESGEYARVDFIEFIPVNTTSNGDTLRGGAGNDTAYGGDGDDAIYGESGDDTLYGDFNSTGAVTITTTTPQTLTFQQGLNSYTGTVDTVIDEYYGSADNPYAQSSALLVDRDWGGYEVQSLIRFEDIFGSQAGQIGMNTTINSAVLEFQVSDGGSSFEVYEMLTEWGDNATWTSMGNGIQADGVEASGTAIATTNYVETGTLEIDVTSSLQTWQQNPDANHGWTFLSTGTNGVDLDSAEGSIAPKLVVNLTSASSSTFASLPDGKVYNGSLYTLSSSTGWQNAQNEAESIGGNLVTINTAAENQWLLDNFGTQSDWLWTGLTDQNQEGTFEWISGQEVSYTNWAPGQPHDDTNGTQDYAILNWNNQGWDDNQGNWGWQGIIEKELPINIEQGIFHNGSVYVLTDTAMNWGEAQTYAESLGGNLVTINDAAEETWIHNEFGTNERFWLGLSDAETEGVWKWASGEVSDWITGASNPGIYTNWSPGQPDDYVVANGQDYAVMNYVMSGETLARWDDHGSSSEYRGLVEIKVVPDMDPGNDHLVGGSGNDILAGGEGDDQLNGTDQFAIGLSEQDTLTGGAGADTFILGDAASAYYGTQGELDFATITDFDIAEDVIQLHGSSGSYTRVTQPNHDVHLYLDGQDLVAKLEFSQATTIDLNGRAFEYV